MTDATEIVLRFRLVLQDLWNNFCWRSTDLRELEPMHQFERLKLPLYRFFVLGALGSHDTPEPETLFGPAFRVVPQKNAEGARIGSLKGLINLRGKGLWEEITLDLNDEDISFHLLDFFNWRLFYWRDYNLYRVKINRWKDHDERVGFEILVDVLRVDVLCDTSLL